MKVIYYVTEGNTDRIVINALISEWLGDEEYVPRHIQPPSSEYACALHTSLSQGWKGVVSWCKGDSNIGPAGRDEALKSADCLIIHIDADVAFEHDFRSPIFPNQEVSDQCEWVRESLCSAFPGGLPNNVALCIPAQDLESWVVTALHTDISDEHSPIEKATKPIELIPKLPHKLWRYRDGELKKTGSAYAAAADSIVAGWKHCVNTEKDRCPQAIRFEADVREVLGKPTDK